MKQDKQESKMFFTWHSRMSSGFRRALQKSINKSGHAQVYAEDLIVNCNNDSIKALSAARRQRDLARRNSREWGFFGQVVGVLRQMQKEA